MAFYRTFNFSVSDHSRCPNTFFLFEDKTAVVVVVSYRSVPRNPVRFKALTKIKQVLSAIFLRNCILGLSLTSSFA